jgi:hypothetical protein
MVVNAFKGNINLNTLILGSSSKLKPDVIAQLRIMCESIQNSFQVVRNSLLVGNRNKSHYDMTNDTAKWEE